MMNKMYLTRREVFSASHRLWNPDLTEEQNTRLFDKCANANGHGHNYVLEVTVCGNVKEDSGYAIDFKKLKHVVSSEIIEKVDHRHLNYDVDFMKDVIPTAENIARVFWKVLEPKIEGAKLYSIRLHETENNVVEFRGEE
jgi:6-pyruvoyltetrahydropterin/6-carboxytetrahydropterin synthase